MLPTRRFAPRPYRPNPVERLGGRTGTFDDDADLELLAPIEEPVAPRAEEKPAAEEKRVSDRKLRATLEASNKKSIILKADFESAYEKLKRNEEKLRSDSSARYDVHTDALNQKIAADPRFKGLDKTKAASLRASIVSQADKLWRQEEHARTAPERAALEAERDALEAIRTAWNEQQARASGASRELLKRRAKEEARETRRLRAEQKPELLREADRAAQRHRIQSRQEMQAQLDELAERARKRRLESPTYDPDIAAQQRRAQLVAARQMTGAVSEPTGKVGPEVYVIRVRSPEYLQLHAAYAALQKAQSEGHRFQLRDPRVQQIVRHFIACFTPNPMFQKNVFSLFRGREAFYTPGIENPTSKDIVVRADPDASQSASGDDYTKAAVKRGLAFQNVFQSYMMFMAVQANLEEESEDVRFATIEKARSQMVRYGSSDSVVGFGLESTLGTNNDMYTPYMEAVNMIAGKARGFGKIDLNIRIAGRELWAFGWAAETGFTEAAVAERDSQYERRDIEKQQRKAMREQLRNLKFAKFRERRADSIAAAKQALQDLQGGDPVVLGVGEEQVATKDYFYEPETPKSLRTTDYNVAEAGSKPDDFGFGFIENPIRRWRERYYGR